MTQARGVHGVEEGSQISSSMNRAPQMLIQLGQYKPTLSKIHQSTKTAVSSLLAPLQSQRVLSKTHTKPSKSTIEQKIREATDLKEPKVEQHFTKLDIQALSSKKPNLLVSALAQGLQRHKPKVFVEE